MSRELRAGDTWGPRDISEGGSMGIIVRAFNAAVAAGWVPHLPESQRCRKCPRPHEPFHHLCAPCGAIAADAMNGAPAAPFVAPDASAATCPRTIADGPHRRCPQCDPTCAPQGEP